MLTNAIFATIIAILTIALGAIIGIIFGILSVGAVSLPFAIVGAAIGGAFGMLEAKDAITDI